jgi:glycosyltransferase involved in cell wall biosynthesis
MDSSGARRPIVYDVTRLVTRALNPAPNGIDRIDFALAAHLLREPGNQALICTLLGPRLAPAAAAAKTIGEIEAYWRERADPAADAALATLVAALADRVASRQTPPRRIQKKPNLALLSQNWRALRDWALRSGARPQDAPANAVFFNASGFLLDKHWFLRWLEQRRDVRAVFYVHDLLAVDYPEFFWPTEAAAQERRMRNICRLGAGVVTGSKVVAKRFQAFAAGHGRSDLRICVARPPISPVFEEQATTPVELESCCYFVICGTIEPRKNHLMLLNVWRELATRPAPPKLLIVGKRGWLNTHVLDLLHKSPALRSLVIETGGLSTPGLRRLLAGARALLAPSFAEGFGLPVAEAIAAGVPVIASDIEVFREIGGDAPDYIDPLDGLGWLEAVVDYAQDDSPRRSEALARLERAKHVEREDFFTAVDAFMQEVGAVC